MNKNLEACDTAELKTKNRMKYEKRIESFELVNSSIFGNKSKVKTKYVFRLHFIDKSTLDMSDLDNKLPDWVIGEVCTYEIDDEKNLLYFKIEEN